MSTSASEHCRVRFARAVCKGQVFEGVVGDGVFCADHLQVALDQVRLLAPCTPTKIIGVGRNYAEHAAETGSQIPAEPLLFLKAPSALNHPDSDIVIPPQSRQVDYEGELAVVIGTRCRNVPRADAPAVVRGYTIGNDVTARDLQRSDNQWSRAKGFDSFAPLGPWIETDLDLRRARIKTYVNGALRQDAPTSAMIFDVGALVEYVSAAFTLEPGDVILTGTPSGIGQLRAGDEVRVDIDGIGSLSNRVVEGR